MKTNKTKTNFLLPTMLVGSFITSAYAAENVVKIGGVMDVTGIYYKTNGDHSQQKLSTYNKKFGFYSSGHFLVDYQLLSDTGIKYGAKISLQQTTRNDRGGPFGIYIESEYGKLEIGSDKSAMAKMIITGYRASCASGNGWDSFVVASPKKGGIAKVPYITNFCNFLDAKTRTSMLSDYSRKITYYTPKLRLNNHKIQVGLSYIPDSSNAGHGEVDAANLHNIVTGSNYKFAFKDGIAYGLTYETKLYGDIITKLSFVGERGTPIAFNKDTEARADVRFKNLNTYNIGGEIIYNALSISGAYMNYNKSIVNTSRSESSLYSIGLKYRFHNSKFAASVNHFHSSNRKNKLSAESVGLDYLACAGVRLHAQVTHFYTNGQYTEQNILKKDKSNGTVVLLGGKISL